MVSRRTNFGERSEPAPSRGGKLQLAGGGGGGGGAAQSHVSPLNQVLTHAARAAASQLFSHSVAARRALVRAMHDCTLVLSLILV